MHRVKSTMGDAVFQVIEDYSGRVIESFYTEKVAKEFCDRLKEQEYWKKMDRKLYEQQQEKEGIMTPEEFRIKMEELQKNDIDTEITHRSMDRLMCDLLEELGYGDGLLVFNNTRKWYS